MKTLLLILFISLSASAEDNFANEAGVIAKGLRLSLMQNLSREIEKNGTVSAIPFCHMNVQPIAKTSVGEKVQNYDFGRTSHKVRNPKNSPEPWATQYLKEYQGTMKGQKPAGPIIHRLADSRRVYLEPLYVEGKCLQCHGENVSAPVAKELDRIYPKDQARGFKAGEFRGFIWVMEKKPHPGHKTGG